MSEHQHADHDEHAAKDPVCGMSVDPHTAEHRSRHAGKTWYFCSARCQSKFDESPDKYLGEEQKPAEPVAPAPCTPARCTRRFVSRALAIAPSAEWGWSRNK